MTADLITQGFAGQEIRIVLLDGDPWFVATDVCAALRHTNTTVALRMLEDDQIRRMPRSEALNLVQGSLDRRVQHLNMVSESGLYELTFRSQAAGAGAFRKWVTGTVLPEIRRTGSYQPAAAPMALPSHPEALRGWADALEAQHRAEAELAIAAPKAAMATALMDAAGDYSVRQAAQILSRDPGVTSIGQNKMFALLKGLGWLDRNNIPYQRHVDLGRIVARTNYWADPKGDHQHIYTQPRITPKGLTWLHGHLGGTNPLELDQVAEQLTLGSVA